MHICSLPLVHRPKGVLLIFDFFGHLEEEFHSHPTDVPARPVTLLAGGTARSSGWKLRAVGLEHNEPKACSPYYAPWKLTVWPPDRRLSC